MKKIEIIAEAGVNHNGSIVYAKKLIDEAKKAGADYVKFQTYRTEKLLNKNGLLANYQKKNTKFKSSYNMLKKYELSFRDFLNLKKYCLRKKIKFLSTPFDLDSIKMLKKLKLETIKISSGDFSNLQLINEALSFKKILLSTGLSDHKEIEKVLHFIKKKKKFKSVCLLHCNTDYPTKPVDVNLLSIVYLKKKFNVNIGFSDHSEGILAPVAASALGAMVIEKHITLNKNMEGPDHKSSIEPLEFKKMVRDIRLTEKFLGKKEKIITNSAAKNLIASSKAIYAKKDISKGEKFSKNNLIIQRPGGGISPLKWFDMLGSKSKNHFKKGDKIK